MDMLVLAAVLVAAALHAFWNFQVRGSGDKAVGLGAVVVGHLPVALLSLLFVDLPPLSSWGFIAASATLHLGYQIFLMHAYRFGELTQIYPIARGSAPLIIALASLVFLPVTIAPLEILGILMVSGGIILHGIFQFHWVNAPLTGLVLALVTGCFIAGYSIVDGFGARHAATGFGYFAMLTIVNALVFALYLRVVHPGVLSRIPGEARQTMLVGGTLSYFAYGLVLWAMLSAPIAVVSAVRETSVLFALVLGVVFLKEQLTRMKIVVTLVILAGVVVLRLA